MRHGAPYQQRSEAWQSIKAKKRIVSVIDNDRDNQYVINSV